MRVGCWRCLCRFFFLLIDTYTFLQIGRQTAPSTPVITRNVPDHSVKAVWSKASRGGSSCKCLHFNLMNYMCGTFNWRSVVWVFSVMVRGGWMEVESPFESLHCSALQPITSGLGFSRWQPRICRADFDFYPQFPPLFFWAVKQDKSGNREAKRVLIRLHLTINIKVFWKHWGPKWKNPLMNHSVFGKQREDTNNYIKGIQWVDICILFIWSLKLSGVWRGFASIWFSPLPEMIRTR